MYNQFPTTYGKLVFAQFNKKIIIHIRFEEKDIYIYIYINFMMCYQLILSHYILIFIDFMFKVQMHLIQFQNIYKPSKLTCVILKMMMS